MFVFLLLFALIGCNQTSQSENSELSSTQESSSTSETTVTYELSIRGVGRNEEKIVSEQVIVPPGDYVLSLSEEMSTDVAEKKVEGDFIEGGIDNAIVDIDYPYEESRRDGTVVTAAEYSLADIPSGKVVTITITEDLQSRLGLPAAQIRLVCEGYESMLEGAWECDADISIIGAEDIDQEELKNAFASIYFEFSEDGTGRWITQVKEQYEDVVPSTDIAFTYVLDGDRLDIVQENGTKDSFVISFTGDNLIMDGRTHMELNPVSLRGE